MKFVSRVTGTCLPSGNHTKIHWHLHSLVPHGLECLVITKPQTPVEVLDARVVILCDFVDREEAGKRDVVELSG